MTTTDTTAPDTYGLRKADLGQLVELLKDEHTRKHDFIAPATSLRSENGVLVVRGTDVELTNDGVVSYDGRYALNSVAVEGLSAKLDIPLGYLRRMQTNRVDMFDDNINGWLRGTDKLVDSPDGIRYQPATPDPRRFMVRTLRGQGDGVVRAFLSDRYKIVDNLDVLMSTLDGIREAGVNVRIDGCDLTERNMWVRVVCEEIGAYAGDLVENYRSPFGGRPGRDLPLVWAGFELSNSEVGSGQFAITPRIVFQVCTNGQTVTRDAVGTRHLGAKMDDGVIRWSNETLQANLDLIRKQTGDAVKTFLNIEYVEKKLAEIRGRADVEVNPSTVVETVAKSLKYTEAQQANILDHFIRGGIVTAGGVMQAVTSAAQLEADGDSAAALEASAFEALRVAATAGRR